MGSDLQCWLWYIRASKPLVQVDCGAVETVLLIIVLSGVLVHPITRALSPEGSYYIFYIISIYNLVTAKQFLELLHETHQFRPIHDVGGDHLVTLDF